MARHIFFVIVFDTVVWRGERNLSVLFWKKTLLIAQGYGKLTIGFIVVYVVPVLTLGVWKIRTAGAAASGSGG